MRCSVCVPAVRVTADVVTSYASNLHVDNIQHFWYLRCSHCCLNHVVVFAGVSVRTHVAVRHVLTVSLLSTFLRLVLATQHVNAV